MELGGRTENLTSTALNEAGHIQCRKDNEHWITGSWICFMFTVSSKKFNLPYALITSDANAFGWLAGLSPFPHCAHVKIGNVSLCFFAWDLMVPWCSVSRFYYPTFSQTSAYPDTQKTLSLLNTPGSVLSKKGVRKFVHFLFDLWLKEIGLVSATFLLLIIPPILPFAAISSMIRNDFSTHVFFFHYQFYQLKTTHICVAHQIFPEEKPVCSDQMTICLSQRYFSIWPHFTKTKFHKLKPERMHLKKKKRKASDIYEKTTSMETLKFLLK